MITQQQDIMQKAGITLRLGAIVIHFNTHYFGERHYANDITYRLKISINRHLSFSRAQKKHLHTYLLHKLKTPEDVDFINHEIATLNAKKQRSVRRILVNIAFADKKLTLAKKECMTALYVALGFNEALLIKDLDAKGLSLTTTEDAIKVEHEAENEMNNVVKVDFSQQAKNRRLYAAEIQALRRSLALLSTAMQASANKEKCDHTSCDVIPLVRHRK
jgi:hypothetical protein